MAWLLDALDQGAQWLAIDGLGASGKSTLADRVLAAAPQPPIGRGLALVHLDDFTRPGTVGWERDRFREQVVDPLRAGTTARYQRWHWTSDEPGDWVEIPAASAVLVEGIGATEPPEGVAWDRLVWLAAAPSVRTRRAEQRDPGRFGCWSSTWRPIEDEWFVRAQPWRIADLVWVAN